jgi:hypothetical protein
MNHINILKRALNITVNYRALWIFGMLLALTTGSGNGGNGNMSGSSGNNGSNGNTDFSWHNPFDEFSEPSAEVVNMWIGIAIGLACLVLVLIVIGSIARYVSETALIRMVNEGENSGNQLTIREGFRLGWSRAAWKMFLMDFLTSLAFLVAFLVVLAIAGLPFLVWLTENTPLQVIGSIIGGGLLLLVIFAAILAGLALTLVIYFARRVCALEDLGVRDSLRRGYEIVKGRLGDIFMMGVIMFGLGLVWALVVIPVFLAIVVLAALVAGLPALLAGSIAGFFTTGHTPWIVAAIVGGPIFLILVILPSTLIGGWQNVFSSATWTLTYREALALEQIKTDVEPAVENT